MKKARITFLSSLLSLAVTLPLYWVGEGGIPLYNLYNKVVTVVGMLLSMLAIWRIYNEIIVKQIGSLLPPALLLLFGVGVPYVCYTAAETMVATALFFISQVLLFYTYQRTDIERVVVISSCLLSAATLFEPLFLLYFPMVWLGLYLFRSITFRVWVASLLGVATPYWLALGLTALEINLFPEKLYDGTLWQITIPQLASYSVHTLVYLALLFVISLLAMINNTVRNTFNRVQTRIMCSYINYLWFYTLVVMVVYSTQYLSLLPIWIGCSAIQVGHSIRQNKGKNSPLQIFILFVLFILLFAWSY